MSAPPSSAGSPSLRALFSSRAGHLALAVLVVELLAGLVRHRWSKAMDLVTALHDMGIETILAGARAAGTLDDVEQQVFEVSVELERDQGLREALEPSRRASTDARVRLARRIFSPMLSGPAMSLVIWCVRHRSQSGVTRNLRSSSPPVCRTGPSPTSSPPSR